MTNIIEWTGYSEGALPKGQGERVVVTPDGNTWINIGDEYFNCHPLTQGVYPIRWKAFSFDNAEQHFEGEAK